MLRSLLLALVLVSAAPETARAAERDWPIPNGHFFTQTTTDTRGYSVVDDHTARFWTEFRRLGGVNALGYPISQPFDWEEFRVQAFQRHVLQWRPEMGQAYLVNVFDRLNALGHDGYLEVHRQTPPHGGDLGGASARLALLDAQPAIRAAYFAVVGDAVQANGLPTAPIADVGNHYALRAQRAVFQLWKQDVPWARAGRVTVALGGSIARELGALPAGDALRPIEPPSVNRRVMMYHVEWDPASWRSLQANADAVDVVGAQWVWVDPCGGLSTRDDQTLKALARERGFAIYPSLYTLSGWLNHRLLTDQPTRDRFLANLIRYLEEEGYPGFDLDLEGVEAGDRPAFSSFVAELADALHTRGKKLGLAIPPKENDTRTGWAGAYDYRELGRHADQITLMTYEYHGTWSGAGAVAPYPRVEAAAEYAASVMPPSKVMLGLAFYGYDWNVTTPGHTRAFGYPEAAALAARYETPLVLDPAARSATFRYRAAAGDPLPVVPRAPPLRNHLTTRAAPPCDVKPPPGPPPGPTPVPPRPGTLQDHVVWLEEAGSAAARLGIADRLGTNIAAWRLGQEDPAVWDVLRTWRRPG